MKNQAEFFMGANSPNGFHSFYDELANVKTGYRSFLIKGGPGTGKSGLMKRVAECFGESESLIEKIHCSSDPNSLDGIILHDGKCSVADATPPHVIEPSLPGGYETVINICEYIDEDITQSRVNRLVKLMAENSQGHIRCQGFIRAADILLKNNSFYAEKATDYRKIKLTANKIAKEEFTLKADNPTEHKRLLSAVTNQGVVTYTATVDTLCDRVYVINDDYGAAAYPLLSVLRDEALKKGYEIFSCYCPLSPDYKLEHLFIRDLRLGFVTQNKFNSFSDIKPYKVINYSRFTDMKALNEQSKYLRFNRKLAASLLDSAVNSLKQAKLIHDEIEKQYFDAVNFAEVSKKTEEVIAKIKLRYQTPPAL